jgi:hypothetical protein
VSNILRKLIGEKKEWRTSLNADVTGKLAD